MGRQRNLKKIVEIQDTTPNTPPRSPQLFFVTGLILVALGIISSQWVLGFISSLLDINLKLAGMEGIARIWGLKVVFLTLGFPLLLYRYRSNRYARVFFDVSMGVVFTMALLLCIEVVFYTLNLFKPPLKPKTTVVSSEVYVELDEALGYKLKPGLQITETQTIEGQQIYDVVYTIDDKGRRVTPVSRPEDRTHFILFFGGSYTFGAGLNDDETLPAYVGEFAPDYRPYNYGVPGYGTQQVFAKLQSDDLAAEIPQKQGIAIYTFICAHIKRVIGTSDMQNAWGEFMPYYSLDAEGELVRNGNLISSRPTRAVLFTAVEISQTAKYFHLTLPRINDSHVSLTARMIEEAAKNYKKNFDSDAFYVLLYPPAPCASRLTPYLDEANINYLNYDSLFTLDDEGLWIPDGHPTAPAQKIVAEKLVTDLGIAPQK